MGFFFVIVVLIPPFKPFFFPPRKYPSFSEHSLPLCSLYLKFPVTLNYWSHMSLALFLHQKLACVPSSNIHFLSLSGDKNRLLRKTDPRFLLLPFYGCNETLWPRQVIEQSVYLGLGFQRVRVHDGGVEVAESKNCILRAEPVGSQIHLQAGSLKVQGCLLWLPQTRSWPLILSNSSIYCGPSFQRHKPTGDILIQSTHK